MPAYLIVGDVTKDVLAGSTRPGGTALYAAAMALKLGYDARLVTAARPEDAPDLKGLQVSLVPSSVTTTFRHERSAGARKMWLMDSGAPIHGSDIPQDWRNSTVWHLAPVFHEVSADVLDVISDESFVGVTLQGFLRGAGSDGEVEPRMADVEAIVDRANAIVLSSEDVPDASRLAQEWALRGTLVVVTHGSEGSEIFTAGHRVKIAALPSRTVDDTGAGDVYATALFTCLHQKDEPTVAASFASAAAALSLESSDVHDLPTTERIKELLAAAGL